jgi:carbamoyl-phosphate synthase small subunit
MSVTVPPELQRAILVLEDGSFYCGYAFGADADAEGEVVFNTGMTGYQEICTDPSYRGQIVTLTYPLIGNYGVNADDVESRRPWLQALVVREYTPEYSNWRAIDDLHDYLRSHGIPGLHSIDTRALVRHLRTYGVMRGVLVRVTEAIVPRHPDGPAIWLAGRAPGVRELVARLMKQARRVLPLSEQPLVEDVTSDAPVHLPNPGGPRVVVMDCGLKQNIARSLARLGADVTIVPYGTPLEEVLRLQPQGVLVGNGPGDPEAAGQAVRLLRDLVKLNHSGQTLPVMGICLGHQLLGLAIGAHTSRLKFGHRGGNQPVKDLRTGRVHITTQNHGFQVDAQSIPTESGFYVSHINLNDQSVEGLAHPYLPVWSVQYHPEGAPGPQDNYYLFEQFLQRAKAQRA